MSNARCIHDEVMIEPIEIEIPGQDSFLGDSGSINEGTTDEHGRMLYTPQSIRIYVDYSNLDLSAGTSKDFIMNVLMPATVDYYAEALQVNYPISGNIAFSTSISYCTTDTAIPSYLRPSGGGVAADLVLFVTAAYSDEDYIAYAIPCLTDKYGRPVAGEVNFNLNSLEPDDETQILSQVSTVLHETAHVLGFSSTLYSRYINPSSPTTKLGESNVYNYIMRNGVNISTIVLPTVLSRAQTYFGCSSLEGLDLEDQGSTGSAGSHWERKILFNEVMTASDLIDIRYSVFTLALLEGTGWYTPDYTMADPLTWGQNAGCSFIKTSCEPSGVSAFDEFCTPSTDDQGCVWGGQYKGSCLMKSGAPSITAYNYFGDIQSYDPFSDNCPYFFPYTYLGTCADPASSVSNSNFPEVFGNTSSCFSSTLRPSSQYSSGLSAEATGCFVSTCTLSGSSYVLTVTIGSQTVTCTGAASTVSISGFVGTFNCPDTDLYCNARANAFCNFGCLGRGTCVDNACVCDDGWTGDGCGTPIRVKSCSSCSSSLTTPDCYGDSCIAVASPTTSGIMVKISVISIIALVMGMLLA